MGDVSTADPVEWFSTSISADGMSFSIAFCIGLAIASFLGAGLLVTQGQSTEPHNFSFQGALPSGDWVFNVVDYPGHREILVKVALEG